MEEERQIVFSVRMTPALREAVAKAADASHLTIMDWVRAVLARAANEGAFAPRKGGKSGRRKAR